MRSSPGLCCALMSPPKGEARCKLLRLDEWRICKSIKEASAGDRLASRGDSWDEVFPESWLDLEKTKVPSSASNLNSGSCISGTKFGSSSRINWPRLRARSAVSQTVALFCLLCLPCFRIDCITLYCLVEGSHMRLDLFCIGEKVGILLRVHSRDAVEQIALESQCDRCTRRFADSLACFVDVDFLDCLLAQLLRIGLDSNRGHQPKNRGQQDVLVRAIRQIAYHTVATPYWWLVRTWRILATSCSPLPQFCLLS